tara:strand:+ start:99 stop:614 length:516 start_codon:yes stop_codon:yes gene_type:complete
VVIADLGLPDGNGIDLIADLAKAQPRVDVLLAISGESFRAADAIAAGADGFMAKPIKSLVQFQQSVLAFLPADRQPKGPCVIGDEVVEPDHMAFQDDMAHIADVLGDKTDNKTLDYVAQFLSGVARIAHDKALETAASALARKRALGHSVDQEKAAITGLVQARLALRMAI